MLMLLLSPAKTMQFETALPPGLPHSRPPFQADAAALMAQLRVQSPAQLATLMGLSEPLAVLNAARHARWSARQTAADARAAAFAFDGPVYRAFDARSLDAEARDFAQQHITILSGLYGALRPLDRVQPHRLEMGTRLISDRGDTLYQFWGTRIAQWLDRRCRGHASPLIVNLASAEYFKAIDRAALRTPVLECVFQQSRSDRHPVIGTLAKRARGLMARWVVQRRASEADALRAFNLDGYRFAAEASRENRLVFRRAADSA